MRLFHKAGDYKAFERVLAEGLERYPVDLLTYCMMPNHWHLVVRPKTDEALGRLDGLGRRDARAPPPRALSDARRRAPVPRAVQEFSGRRGRLLPDVVPLRGSQSASRGPGGTG